MDAFNATECADVGGECRYVGELTLNHFLTFTVAFLCVVSSPSGE